MSAINFRIREELRAERGFRRSILMNYIQAGLFAIISVAYILAFQQSIFNIIAGLIWIGCAGTFLYLNTRYYRYLRESESLRVQLAEEELALRAQLQRAENSR